MLTKNSDTNSNRRSVFKFNRKTVSGLPINLHREMRTDQLKKQNDKRVFLLNDENETYMKGLVKDYLLHGQAFLYKRYDVKQFLVNQ